MAITRQNIEKKDHKQTTKIGQKDLKGHTKRLQNAYEVVT